LSSVSQAIDWEVWIFALYTRSGLQNIQSVVRRCHLSLLGHVAHMSDNIPATAVLRMASDVRDGIPPFSSRPWGCPPITWLHQIHSDCGLSFGDALGCSQDMDVWRTYTTASRWQWRSDWLGRLSPKWPIWCVERNM